MSMKKKAKYIILIILSLVVIISVLAYKSYQQSYYLSYVTTEFDQDDNEIMNIYTLDIKSGQFKKITQLPYCCSYPTAIYDKESQCVYYSNNQKSKDHHDWVLKYNCQTKKSEVVLDCFVRINDILMSNDKNLYIIGSTKKNNIIKPYVYNIKTKKISQIDISKDMCFGDNYNCFNDELLLTGYNDEKSRRMMEKYNNQSIKKDEKDYNIKNRIYKYRNSPQLLTTVSTGNIPIITSDSKKIIYGKYDGFSMNNLQFQQFKDQKNSSYQLDKSIIGLIQLLDNDKLLCIASTTYSEGIYIYDIQNKSFDKELFNSKGESLYSAHYIKE